MLGKYLTAVPKQASIISLLSTMEEENTTI